MLRSSSEREGMDSIGGSSSEYSEYYNYGEEDVDSIPGGSSEYSEYYNYEGEDTDGILGCSSESSEYHSIARSSSEYSEYHSIAGSSSEYSEYYNYGGEDMDSILGSSSEYCNYEREDRISSLTDDLLHQILSFLDTRQAVQTCVLSKRWISVWKSLPYLYFDHSIFPPFMYIDREKWFTTFITHVLARRSPAAGLVEVRFCPSNVPGLSALIAESLIYYAVQHNVQILDFSFSRDLAYGYSIRWPPSLYNCRSIKTLEINNYINIQHDNTIQLPKYLGLPALKSLGLYNFTITEENFDPRVFSSCPNLETLVLKIWVVELTVLKIHAPNLRKLNLSLKPDWHRSPDRCKFEILAPKLTTFKYIGNGCANIVQFMANLDSLDDVHFDMFRYGTRLEQKEANIYEFYMFLLLTIEVKEEDCCYLIDTFKQFRRAKSLTTSLHTLQVLSTYPALLNENKITFTGLKSLKLEVQRPYDDDDDEDVVIPSCVLNLFLSSSTTLRICYT